MFVVVDTEGRLLEPPRLYETESAAQRRCKVVGDSVLPIKLDLRRRPTYIQGLGSGIRKRRYRDGQGKGGSRGGA